MNTKVNVLETQTLHKVEFYLALENQVVQTFEQIFPQSKGQFAIEINEREAVYLEKGIETAIADTAKTLEVNLPLSYMKALRTHYVSRLTYYNDLHALCMNSMYTVQFMTHYQMYRYLTEWVMTRLIEFKGLSLQDFGNKVLVFATMTNETLFCPMHKNAVAELSDKVSKEYYQDVISQPKEAKASVHLLVPTYVENTVNKNNPNNGYNEEYIDWIFTTAKSKRANSYIEQQLVDSNTSYRNIDAVRFHLQTFLDNEYYGLPVDARMAFKRRLTLATHMAISESIQFDGSGRLSLLTPEGGFSKLKSKNLPFFLHMRCINDSLLESYKDPKSEVTRDMVRLKLTEYNYLRQTPLEPKLMKKNFDATMNFLENPSLMKSDKNVNMRPDPNLLSSMFSRINKGKFQ